MQAEVKGTTMPILEVALERGELVREGAYAIEPGLRLRFVHGYPPASTCDAIIIRCASDVP